MFPGEAIVKINGQARKAVGSQLTTAPLERFQERLAILAPSDMAKVESAISVLLELP